MRLLILVATTVLALGGCATGYGPRGFTGGYSDSQIDANTFRVSFQGNGYTTRERVETAALYRAAEVTLQSGYDSFVVIGGNTEASQLLYHMPGSFTATTSGRATTIGGVTTGTAFTSGTYRPGPTIPIRRYEAVVIVRAFKGLKPDGQAFDAREVASYLSPQLGVTPTAQVLAGGLGTGAAGVVAAPRASPLLPPAAAPASTITSQAAPSTPPPAVPIDNAARAAAVSMIPVEPPVKPSRPITGTILSRPGPARGLGQLAVANELSRDAVVILRAPKSPDRDLSFYVRAGERAALTDVAEGTYELMYITGDG